MGKVMKLNFNVFSDSLRASIKGLADVVVCPYSLGAVLWGFCFRTIPAI